MSRSRRSGPKSARVRQSGHQEEGSSACPSALSAQEESALSECIKQGKAALEKLVSVLVPRCLDSLPTEASIGIRPEEFSLPIREGLLEAIEKHCFHGQPDQVLASLIVGRVRGKVSSFIDSKKNDDCAPIDGANWADEHITLALLGDWLKDEIFLEAWPLLESRAAALRKLTDAYDPLATTIALSFKGRSHDLPGDDLKQIAFLGLQKAAVNFDALRGSFRKFAPELIKHELVDALRKAKGGSAHCVRKRAVFKKEQNRLTHEFGRWPTQDEVFESLRLKKTSLRNLRQDLAMANPESLDQYQEAVGELPEDRSATQPVAELERSEAAQILEKALLRLDEDERKVWLLRKQEVLTQERTAQRLGFSLHEVRKLETSAKRKLQVQAKDVGPVVGLSP